MTDDLLERLAALEHEQWAHWTRYLLDNLTPENIARWRRQIDTPYSALSLREQESDRLWAKRALEVMGHAERRRRMTMYWKYLVYVIRHKWFVFLASCRLGVWWLGVVHDWSKLRLGEFIPYARHFYGPKRKEWRDSTGYYKPTQTGDLAFDFAWLLHQKRNKHHWQYWICPQDDGGFQTFEMPDHYRREMLADWIGAGLAQGKPDTIAWYIKNKSRMILAPETRAWIEQRLSEGEVRR